MADDEKVPCFLVWQLATDGGRPYLVAVDTSDVRAEQHKKAVLETARLEGRKTDVIIEPSFLNHLYGESMGQGLDELRKMYRTHRDRTGG